MIQSRSDLHRYLMADRYAMEMKDRFPCHLHDYEHSWIWSFERALRYHEYFYNNWHSSKGIKRILYRLACLFAGYRHNRLGLKLGFTVPVNVFEEGLRINHIGSLTVNAHARVGKFADIHSGVNIGNKDMWDSVPVIGDNVWIGPGAKLFGKIKIGDRCSIGANAVVNKSFPDNVTIAGCPAKIISEKGNVWHRSLEDAEKWE